MGGSLYMHSHATASIDFGRQKRWRLEICGGLDALGLLSLVVAGGAAARAPERTPVSHLRPCCRTRTSSKGLSAPSRGKGAVCQASFHRDSPGVSTYIRSGRRLRISL